MISVGDLHAGLFCGARFLSKRDWKMYGLFKNYPDSGFSVGPLFFWKEDIK